jgi:hypothetical protein
LHTEFEVHKKWACPACLLGACAIASALSATALRETLGAFGQLAWPYLYPWPQRPPGLIDTAFDELAKRWTPILDAFDLEWECALKDAEQGAAEGARFIADHIIVAAGKALDDFAAAGTDAAANRRMLGLNRDGGAP